MFIIQCPHTTMEHTRDSRRKRNQQRKIFDIPHKTVAEA
jgi:hypothetical protein